MEDERTELIIRDAGVQLGSMQLAGPEEVVGRATAIANELAKIIKDKKLFSKIQGKDFVRVEGWTTLGALLGVTPQEVSNSADEGGVYTAVVELVRVSDGRIVGRASAECGAPDEVDRSGHPTWADRPQYARRSMAATRATGKAFRLAFSWIMSLAGYEVTPWEEMQGVVFDEPKKAQPTKAKKDALQISRPYDAQELKATIVKIMSAEKQKQTKATDVMRKVAAAQMNTLFGGDDNRHLACKYLVGAESTGKMGSEKIAALLRWMKVERFDDIPDEVVIAEANAVVKEVVKK